MNISKATTKYIRERPSVAECLDRGLINYSALAREICAKEGLDAFDAVLVACRRYRGRRRQALTREAKIAGLVRKAKVRFRNKIAVAIVDKAQALERALTLQKEIRKERGDFNLIEGEEVFTIITNIEYVPLLKENFGSKLRRVSTDLMQISMIFDHRLENTPGVVSYLYRLLAENDINIREEMSCWTDVMIIIDDRDAAKAMQILSQF